MERSRNTEILETRFIRTNKNKLELVGNANIQKEINTTKEILKLAQRLGNIIKENIWVGIQHNI